MAGNHEMSIDVHGLIAKSFSKEYVEAVVTDAQRIRPSYKDRQDSLVVINARKLAVILDKQAHRGAMIPVDAIEQINPFPTTNVHRRRIRGNPFRSTVRKVAEIVPHALIPKLPV